MVVRRSKVCRPRPPASRSAYAAATRRSRVRNIATGWPTRISAASSIVCLIASPPGTSPRPSRPSESVTIAMLRVKNGPWAPLRLSSIESCPATGTTSTLAMVVGHFFELSVEAATQAPGVVVADGSGQQRGRHVLVGDRTLEALDGEAADAGAARVGRRRVGTAVDHRVADLDTGRPAVEEDPARLELEDRQERGRVLDVAVGGVDGRGELALEGLEAGQQGGHVVVPHHDAGGAEHLVGHGAVVDREQLGRCLVDHRCGGVLAGRGALADDADAVGAAQAGGAAGVGVGDAGGEHLLTGGSADGLAGGPQERVAALAGRQEEQAGVGAELAGAERQAADVRLGERGDVTLERAGQDDDGVDRRHLGVDRDRHRRARRRHGRARGPRHASR